MRRRRESGGEAISVFCAPLVVLDNLALAPALRES